MWHPHHERLEIPHFAHDFQVMYDIVVNEFIPKWTLKEDRQVLEARRTLLAKHINGPYESALMPNVFWNRVVEVDLANKPVDVYGADESGVLCWNGVVEVVEGVVLQEDEGVVGV